MAALLQTLERYRAQGLNRARNKDPAQPAGMVNFSTQSLIIADQGNKSPIVSPMAGAGYLT